MRSWAPLRKTGFGIDARRHAVQRRCAVLLDSRAGNYSNLNQFKAMLLVGGILRAAADEHAQELKREKFQGIPQEI